MAKKKLVLGILADLWPIIYSYCVTVYCIICSQRINQKAFSNWLSQYLSFLDFLINRFYPVKKCKKLFLIWSIFIFPRNFFQYIFPDGKVWGYPTLVISWFSDFNYYSKILTFFEHYLVFAVFKSLSVEFRS